MANTKNVYLWSLNRLTTLIDETINDDYDFVIAICGRRGLGKSTLGFHIANRVSFAHFNPKRDIIYSKKEVLESVAKKKKGIIMGDEIIATAFNRDFFTKESKDFIKILTMYRDNHNLLIVCIPSFASLDIQFKSLIRLRIDIIKRGQGIVHTPNRSVYSKDKWDSYVNEKIERTWIESGIQKPQYQNLTTFRGVIKFPDLTQKQKLLYQQIKQEKRNVVLESEITDDESPVTPIDKLLMHLLEGDIRHSDHFKEICYFLGLDLKNARSRLCEKMKTLQIHKPIRKFYMLPNR